MQIHYLQICYLQERTATYLALSVTPHYQQILCWCTWCRSGGSAWLWAWRRMVLVILRLPELDQFSASNRYWTVGNHQAHLSASRLSLLSWAPSQGRPLNPGNYDQALSLWTMLSIKSYKTIWRWRGGNPTESKSVHNFLHVYLGGLYWTTCLDVITVYGLISYSYEQYQAIQAC